MNYLKSLKSMNLSNIHDGKEIEIRVDRKFSRN
jgi:hypothetical protein